MSIAAFAEHVNGEFVAGCLIATVGGKRQYLHRDGEFTSKGREMYLAWDGENAPSMAIAAPRPRGRPKLNRDVEVDHG